MNCDASGAKMRILAPGDSTRREKAAPLYKLVMSTSSTLVDFPGGSMLLAL